MAIFDGIFKEKKQQKKRSHTSDRGDGFLSSEIKKPSSKNEDGVNVLCVLMKESKGGMV